MQRRGEIARLVEHIGDAAGHAGGEIAPGRPEHDHAAAGHVFAAVVADGFHHGIDAAVADAEAFAGHAADIGLAAGGAVKGHVADDDVLLRHEGGLRRREDDELAAGQAFAEVVVGVAFQEEGHALGHERAEALPGAAGEMDLDGVLGQPLGAPAPGDLAADDGADDAVDVADGQDGQHLLLALDGGGAELAQDGVVERLFEAVVLRNLAEAAHARRHFGLVKDLAEVQAPGLPVVHGLLDFEAVGAADHLVHLPEAELGHQLAHFLGDHAHEVDDVLRLAREALAQLRVLGGDADRAGVEVADAHHDAAHRHQRRGGEAEFLGPEQGGDDHVAAGLQLAVGLDDDARAQVVEHEGLVRLGQAELPRDAGVLDAGLRRGARAAVVAADEHDVRVRLGDAGGDGADADLGHELDADARVMVGVLQVVDQLGQVLDRVDVMVRRRRDQADARGGVADLGDPGIDLLPGQLAAFAGLGALGHLDLELLGVDQVMAGDAEPAGGDLLDGAVLRVAVRQRHVAFGVFAAFAGVALAADAVHGDGERLVRFLADGAVAHGAGLEALHDALDRLDLLDGNGLDLLEVEQAAQRAPVPALLVDQRGILLEDLVAAGAHRRLQLVDGLRIEQVILAVLAPLVLAAGVEHDGR